MLTMKGSTPLESWEVFTFEADLVREKESVSSEAWNVTQNPRVLADESKKFAAAKNEEKIIRRTRWKSVKTICPRRSRCHPSHRIRANLSNGTFRFLIFIWGTLNSNIWWNHALRLATKLSRARRNSRRKVTNCLSRVKCSQTFSQTF